jgi:hypothetical protein
MLSATVAAAFVARDCDGFDDWLGGVPVNWMLASCAHQLHRYGETYAVPVF